MRNWFIISGVVLVILLVFLFAPVIPYQSQVYRVGGGTYDSWKSSVSPLFLVLGCGVLHGTVLTTDVVGNGSWAYHKAMTSVMLTCSYHPTEILGGVG